MSAMIGAKVAYWRKRRGKSQRVLAGMAGISQPYLSLVESGRRPVERRSTLVGLAEALEVSVAELTGKPGDPTDPVKARAAAQVPAIREALVMREAGETIEQVGDVDASLAARAAYDFTAAAPMLPGLIGGAAGTDLVQVGAVAASVLDHIGYQDLSREAARLCVHAARETEDAAWLGTADLIHAWCLPAESRMSPILATRAADNIQPHIGQPRTRRAYGMLHLLAALRSATFHKPNDANDHLREADEVAKSLGEPDDWNDLAQICFGPANVAMWRVATLAELGDSAQALAAADDVVVERIPFKHRQASYLLDVMSLLASLKHDTEAVAAFLRAETICPQWVRLRPTARDTIEAIWRRTQRRAAPEPLRKAAEMVGLDVR